MSLTVLDLVELSPSEEIVDALVKDYTLDETKRVSLGECLNKKNNKLDKDKGAELKAFLKDLDGGKVQIRQRGKEGYELRSATLEDTIRKMKLDRDYFPIQKVKDIMTGLRCPADLHLYADDYGTGEDV